MYLCYMYIYHPPFYEMCRFSAYLFNPTSRCGNRFHLYTIHKRAFETSFSFLFPFVHSFACIISLLHLTIYFPIFSIAILDDVLER